MQAVAALVVGIENTNLFKMVDDIIKSKKWCEFCPDVLCIKCDGSKGRHSVTKAHFLTVVFLAVLPRLSTGGAYYKRRLGNLLPDAKDLSEPLKSEVVALGQAWEGLCDVISCRTGDDCQGEEEKAKTANNVASNGAHDARRGACCGPD
mmetsp:Transcript_27132/g.43614  ORF Transcript_27132/g.43614 Transcript_27132/m.43614 type:complete len:149 (+) Transcript_27132:178-624(+)